MTLPPSDFYLLWPTRLSAQFGSGRTALVAVLLRPYGQVRAKRRGALGMSETRGFPLASRRPRRNGT